MIQRKKKKEEEIEVRLRDDEEDEEESFVDEQMRQATQESIKSHHEWEDRKRFRQRTGGWQNVYEEGGGCYTRASGL